MKRLEVWLVRAPGDERPVGELAENRGRVYFEYAAEFLRHPLWLSPFKLPPESGLIEHRERDFGPIFGLFDDSLPDGWGLLLLDRFLRQRGSALAEMSVLDRLAFLGTRTMGALTYHPPAGPTGHNARVLDLHEMARAAQEVLEGTAKEVLPQLLRAGGSPGGARPKVLVGVQGESIRSGEEDLPPGFEPWIVKFHSREDLPDAGPVELAYALMAEEAGIAMPPTRLFETSGGERFFGVLRFDRRANHRYHVHTFGNLVHADFRIPSCDYRQLLEVVKILTRDHSDVVECFRRMVFNVLAHNRDDHVKNFAFRMHHAGQWALAPAYDLMFAPGPGGEHSMTVAGEGRAPQKRHLLELATAVGIDPQESDAILEQVATAVGRWRNQAREAGVGVQSTREIAKAIDRCRMAFR